MPKVIKATAVERKKYPIPLRSQPSLPYNTLAAWKDLLCVVPMKRDELSLISSFMKLCQHGRYPSVTAVRVDTGITKAKSIPLWADLHVKGYVQLIDSTTNPTIHVAVHPLLWGNLGIPKPVAKILPKATRYLLQKQLHPTGRVVYHVCLSWFDTFCYWPEPSDIAMALGLTREGTRIWLRKLTHMELINHQSHLIFNEPSERRLVEE